MTKVFLNEEMKPYNELTREEKHIIIDAMIDGNCEVYFVSWNHKENCHVYGTSVYRTKPKEYKKLDIPWEVIDEKWKWAAMDNNRQLFLFEGKPTWDYDEWLYYSSLGTCFELSYVLKLDTTDIIAEHSLTQRPEGV